MGCRAGSSRVWGETSHGEHVEQRPKDHKAQQWDMLKGQQMLLRYCNTVFWFCHFCPSPVAFVLLQTGNVVAAWLWPTGVTDQSTYFRATCAHFSWCFCCHNSLFPASALPWPSSEEATYFASDLSGKNVLLIASSCGRGVRSLVLGFKRIPNVGMHNVFLFLICFLGVLHLVQEMKLQHISPSTHRLPTSSQREGTRDQAFQLW